MHLSFRLYDSGKAKYHSSIFDLISGDKETKQTKGLAYIFSQYPEFVYAFLAYPSVDQGIKEMLGFSLTKRNVSAIEVSAERYTDNKTRADIILRIDHNNKPLLALVCEAKSAKVNVNKDALTSQIQRYVHDSNFPGLEPYRRIGIVLTKYRQNIESVVCLSWDEVTQLLIDFCRKLEKHELAVQYLNFLLEIDKNMKYYEKEVLSVAASRSLPIVEKTNVYECPDTPEYNYKKPLFITFRQSAGGVMNCLYKIEEIVVFNPKLKSEVETFKNSMLSDSVKQRVLEYIRHTPYPDDLDHNKRFYILSESENIQLPHKPHPRVNNAGKIYYRLVDMLTREIVEPESKMSDDE